MATLTEVSYYTRRIIKWGAVVFFILLISPALLKGAKGLYLLLRPPPPPPPTVKYGKLPKPSFPDTNSEYKPTYQLQTVDGQLPKLSNVGRVYFVEINKSRLLELDRIKPKARVLGFASEPVEQADGQTYIFTHPTLPAVLSVNIISGKMTYTLDWASDPTHYSTPLALTNEQAFAESKSFLQTLGLLPKDLADGKAKYTYFKVSPPEMTPVLSLSEANFIRVDIFRSDLDKLPFVVAGGTKSPVSLLFSSSADRTKRIVELEYQYSRILDDNFATYPLKGVDQAWTELQQGQGFVAIPAGQTVTIRKAGLAYYESSTPQQFLQLVYFFEGDGGFVGYVPAVTASYLE